MKKIIVYTHSDCLLKENGPSHPEKKERLQIILKSIQDISSIDIEIKNAPLAKVDSICLIHTAAYIDNIFSIIPNFGLIGVEKEPYADTFLCPNSKSAILRSCGAGIAAVKQSYYCIMKKEYFVLFDHLVIMPKLLEQMDFVL